MLMQQSRDCMNRRKRKPYLPQVPTCVVENLKIVSNTTHTWDNGLIIASCNNTAHIGPIYEFLELYDHVAALEPGSFVAVT
jgi:hypothetical protein